VSQKRSQSFRVYEYSRREIMPKKRVTIEELFDARMEEIRERHKKPVAARNGAGGLKDRLRQRVEQSRAPKV